MGFAGRWSSGGRHRQRKRTLRANVETALNESHETRHKGVTRPGHIPTPPRPRPDRARPALPQELAATFWDWLNRETWRGMLPLILGRATDPPLGGKLSYWREMHYGEITEPKPES